MIHAIEERARSVGGPSSVVLAGAWSQVTDQDAGEKLFLDSSEVRSQVVADILAVGDRQSRGIGCLCRSKRQSRTPPKHGRT
jgi:hypothetical protein